MACSSFFSFTLTICKLIYPDGCLNRFEQCLSFIPVGIGFIYFLYEGLQFNMSIWVDCLQMNHYQCLIDMLKISLFPSLISMGLLAARFQLNINVQGFKYHCLGQVLAMFYCDLLKLVEFNPIVYMALCSSYFPSVLDHFFCPNF